MGTTTRTGGYECEDVGSFFEPFTTLSPWDDDDDDDDDDKEEEEDDDAACVVGK